MKSLGKQTVSNNSYCDGKHLRSWTENRVVYEKADGTYWINDLSQKKQINKTNAGFECVYKSKTIHSVEIEQLFEGLGFKFKQPGK